MWLTGLASWMWPMRSRLAGYRRKSHALVGHLIGHEGGGSVLALLKRMRVMSERVELITMDTLSAALVVAGAV